jgi:hypothetical protein
MDGISRICLGCQAELGPKMRFCPKCGQPAGAAAAGPGEQAPGGPTATQSGGPGFTAAAPPAPAWDPPGWGEPTATQPRPYQPQRPPPAWPQSSAYPPPAPSYPPSAYQRPPYEPNPSAPPGPPGPPPFESFRPHQAAAPTGEPLAGAPPGAAAGPPPPGPQSQPLPGPPRQPPRRHDGNDPGTPMALWIILLVILLGGGAAAALLLAHPFSHQAINETASSGTKSAAPASGAASPAASPTAPATSSASAPAVAEQQAATSVASMLGQSVSDRAAIVSASNQVASCGPSLSAAPKVFDDAASSRQSLLANLTAMTGRDALPPALLSDLTNAWQASIAADQAYATWASDELAKGCEPNDTSDPGFLATEAPNANATKYKTAFVAQWNPVAARYGLTKYQQGQL